MGRRRRRNNKRKAGAASRAYSARGSTSASRSAAEKISTNPRAYITQQKGTGVDRYQDGDGVYKIPPSRYIKSTKVSTALALQQRARERMEKWGSSAILRRKDSRVDRARSRLGQELHSPNAHHGGKLTQTEKDEAARNLLQKNFKRDMVNEKFFKERDELLQRLEEAEATLKVKTRKAKDIVKEILPKSDILHLINFDLEKQFDRFGKVGPPYVGVIEEVVNPQEIKMSENVFEDTEKNKKGKLITVTRNGLMNTRQLDPPIWRDFKVEYPIFKKLKLPGDDVEDRDLQIGELEWDNEVKTKTLDIIKQRSEDLVNQVVTFFQLNGFLSGSVDELALLGQDSATTLMNVKEELVGAQIEFQKWKTELDLLKAIHLNPAGCKGPLSSTYGKVIPIFEFYNTVSGDYAYSTNFEWDMDQSPGTGYLFQKVYSGHANYAKQVRWNEIGMKFKYINKGLYKVPGVKAPKVKGSLGSGFAIDWEEGGPDGGPSDKFLVTYEGYLSFPSAGTYEFRVFANNTAFLEIQGFDGGWDRIIEREHGEDQTSYGMRKRATKNISDPAESEVGEFAKYKGYKVTDQMILDKKRVGIRFMISEEKNNAGFRVEWRQKGAKVKIRKQFSYTYKNGRYWRRGRRRHHYRTAYYWDWEWTDAYLPIQMDYLSLAAPKNYRFNRVAFGAYDPQEAEHMELSEALPVHKYHNNLSLPDPHGEAGENVPRATEGSGHHYLGKKDKPPSDVEHINKKEWDDMGSDFSALKKYLPKPHPELEKDYTGHGKVLPVHRFFNRETNCYRYVILPDGRRRQARTSEGVLKFEVGTGRRIMETLPTMIGMEYVEQQAGRNNIHFKKHEGKSTDGKNLTPKGVASPSTMVGAGYEWKGIAFYGFEPPGLPPNVPPEVLIFEGKNSFLKIQHTAKWLAYEYRIPLEAKAQDKDGKVTSYVWKILKQYPDMAFYKPKKRGYIIGRSAKISYDFPIGRTQIQCEVKDNRDDTGKDIIDIIILPPGKKSWKALTHKEWVGTGSSRGVAGNRHIFPYTKYVSKSGWNAYTEQHSYDTRDMANLLYQQGFKDSYNNKSRRSSSQLRNMALTRTEHYNVTVQRGWRYSRKMRRWRYRTVRYPNMVTEARKRYKRVTAAYVYSRKGIEYYAKTSKLRQYPSDGELKTRMEDAYNRGYSHGQWPHYLQAQSYKSNTQTKLKHPLVRQQKPSPPRRSWTSRWSRSWRKMWSDVRLKQNIMLVGQSEHGINIYEFNYLWDRNKTYRGVIAQDLLANKMLTHTVSKTFGYYSVDYEDIDVDFKEVKN